MEDTKFFIFVKRFNSLVFMLVGILAVLGFMFAAYSMYKDVTEKRGARNIVNVTDDTSADEKWELGYLMDVEGTPYVMIPLRSSQNYDDSFYSGSPHSTRNYLFINSKTNEKHWLFDTNEYSIINDQLLSEQDYGEDERETRAILYNVVKSDTNGDKMLTNDDLSDVLVSRRDGTGLKTILTGLDIFMGNRTMDKDTVLLIYQKKGLGYSATLSIESFKLSDVSELPKVGPPDEHAH